MVSKEEETAMAKALRVAYQPYDFTIEEEEDWTHTTNTSTHLIAQHNGDVLKQRAGHSY